MTRFSEIDWKRLRYRAWHRGTREMDILLGRFADRHLGAFDDGQVGRFAALLEEPDPDIFDWLAGRGPPPPEHDNDIFTLLKNFRITI